MQFPRQMAARVFVVVVVVRRPTQTQLFGPKDKKGGLENWQNQNMSSNNNNRNSGGINNTRKDKHRVQQKQQQQQFPIGSALRFLRVGLSALGSRRDYVSNKIARARVCVCAPTFTHHQRHSEHLTAKQSRGDGSQFVSCFPSADAAALASTSARSSFV